MKPNKTEFPFLEKAWENKSERRYSKTRNNTVQRMNDESCKSPGVNQKYTKEASQLF